MIKSIGLKNIRVFKDWQNFNISPFTILTGPNDSGKSTFQKMMILLSRGLEKIDDELCDFEKLQFNKETIEHAGGFLNNVNYNNSKENLEFAFEYEDDFWGNIRAELSYELEDNSYDAYAQKIVLKKNNKEFLTFIRSDTRELISELKVDEKNSEINGEKHWHITEKSQPIFLVFLLNLLVDKKKEGEHQKKIQTIDYKLKNNKKLNKEEKRIKKDLENDEIEFDPKFRNNEESKNKTNWSIFDYRDKESLKTLYFDELSDKVYENFSSSHNNVLIHTSLSDLVLGKENILAGTDNVNHKPILKDLNNEGIFTKDDFLEEQIEFEAEFVLFSIQNFIDSLDFKIFTDNSVKVKSMSYASHYLKDNKFKNTMLSSDFEKSRFIKYSSIARILYKNELLGKDFIDEDGNLSFNPLFQEKMNLIKEIAFSLPKSLSKQVYVLTQKYHFSLQNKQIERHLYVSNESSNNLSFLKFGLKFIKEDNSINESIDFVNTWIKEFGIADGFTVKAIKLGGEVLGISYYLKKGKKELLIGDSGKGINQLFYILLSIATIGENKIVALEEPEINLHPALQSKLADMLIMAKAKFNIIFIIETHSEYLIRRFQYLVARSQPLILLNDKRNSLQRVDDIAYRFEREHFKKNKNIEEEKEKRLKKVKKIEKRIEEILSKRTIYRAHGKYDVIEYIVQNSDISIYYLYNLQNIPNDKKQVEKLEIRPDGILKQDFGEGFFDESTRLTMDLLKIQNIN